MMDLKDGNPCRFVEPSSFPPGLLRPFGIMRVEPDGVRWQHRPVVIAAAQRFKSLD